MGITGDIPAPSREPRDNGAALRPDVLHIPDTEAVRAICAPADAPAWFAEDPIRILRYLRLHAQQGSPIEKATEAAMDAAAESLSSIEAPHAFEELDLLLQGTYAGATILAYAPIIARILPIVTQMAACPQNTPYHAYDVLGHTARVIDASPRTSLSRWAALLHDSGKPQCRHVDAAGRDHFKGHAIAGCVIARDILEHLGAPVELCDDVCMLVRMHEWFVPDTDEAVLQVLDVLGGRVDMHRALIALQVADASGKAPGFTDRRDAALRSRDRLDLLCAYASGHTPA